MPIDLNEVRRKDSGRFCGPKAAYLGELKHLFPDHVARGIVVPFGAYYDHYQNATVAVPDEAARALGLATPGEPLPDFVERTYKEFFDVMMPARKSEKELAAWITPRLDDHPLLHPPGAAVARAASEAIREGLDADGLLTSARRRPSAASCAATPTSRTSTTSTAPGSTSPSSTASRSTTSTTA